MSAVTSAPAGSAPATGRRSLSAGAAAGLAAQFVTIGGGLLAQIVVARHLGAADYGAYSVATTLTYLFAIVLRSGLHSLAVRSLARIVASGGGGAREQARHLARLSTVVAAVALPVLGLVALPLANSLFLSGRLGTAAIWVLAATISAEAVRFVYSECFRGFHRQGAAAALGNAGRTLAFVALVVAVVILDDRSTLFAVLVVALVASVVSAVVAGVSLAGWVSARVPAAPDALPSRARASLRQGSPFMLTELAAFGLALGDVLVVSLFGDDTQVALYASASRAASMLSVPAYVLVGLLSPLIAGLWVRGETNRLQRLLARAITVTSVAAVVGLLFTVVFGGTVLGLLFGRQFESAATVLSILALGATANVFFGQGFQLLMLCGRARLATTLATGFGAATVLAELGCGARWGVLGVAVASAGGVAAQQFTLAIVARSVVGLGAYPFARARLNRTCTPPGGDPR